MKALVAGWFSFEQGHATAGDLLAREVACEWLARAGFDYDIAVAPPFEGGVDWRVIDARDYSHAIFVCGPFEKGELERSFLARFAGCRLVGLNLSMKTPIDVWNPFDLLLERDSSANAHPDLVFASRQPHVPVIGVCRVEPYEGGLVDLADAAIKRLIETNKMSVVPIDTRLDVNSVNLRSPAEVESLVARMDAVITTRLHGMVLALKNGIAPVVIDPEAGGAKVRRQAEIIGWPVIFNVDRLHDATLREALEYCLTESAREKASECADRATKTLQELSTRFVSAVRDSSQWEFKYPERITSKTLTDVSPDPLLRSANVQGSKGSKLFARLLNFQRKRHQT